MPSNLMVIRISNYICAADNQQHDKYIFGTLLSFCLRL